MAPLVTWPIDAYSPLIKEAAAHAPLTVMKLVGAGAGGGIASSLMMHWYMSLACWMSRADSLDLCPVAEWYTLGIVSKWLPPA